MAFKPTEAQKQAINSRGALLVSAAAGSGKTAALVEHIMQCILDPEESIDINRLLVVTFTNAAAAEMKERIGKRIQEELKNAPGSPRLIKQQMLLDKANISTIDAFCKNLITQHFEQLDLSPDFKIISETSLTLLKHAAMEETLNDYFENHPQETEYLAKLVGADNGTSRLEESITIIYNYIRSLPFPKQWTDSVCESYRQFDSVSTSLWGIPLMEKGATLVNSAVVTLEQGIKELEWEPDLNPKRVDRLQQGLDGLKKIQKSLQEQNWDDTVSLCNTCPAVNFQGANSPDNAAKETSNNLQRLHKSTLATLKSWFFITQEECKEQCRLLAPAVSLLMDCVWEFSNRLDEKKKQQNTLDFSDIEYAALSLLVTLEDGKAVPTPLAEELSREFAYVMVDEFQDSNDLQTAIYKALSRNGETLFTVGDIKQSIYRFRKANPRNFLTMLDEYPLYDEIHYPGKVLFKGNFRSRPEVCETVNQLFTLVMSREAGDVDYDEDHELIPEQNFPPCHCPVVLDFLERDEREDAQLEADRIAQHIRKFMEAPCVTDDGALRPAKPEDCVILLRSNRTKAPVFVQRLQEHGIPAIAESSDGFFEKREIACVLDLLRTIDNPTDDVALLSTLLSPFFGFTAEEIAQIRLHGKRQSLISCVECHSKEGNQKATDFLTTVDRLRTQAVTQSPKELLQTLYRTYHYPALVQLWDKGDARKQNLLALLSLAEDCEQNGFDRLDGFLAYVTKLSKEERPFTPSVDTAGFRGVRVMSIHHAKGLQFPICFVAGCGARPNNQEYSNPVLLDEKLGVGFTLFNDDTQTKTTTFPREIIKAENKRSAFSEELRILYVAMTRAIDHLVLLSSLDDPVKSVEKSVLALTGQLEETGRIHPQLVLSAPNFWQLLLYYALLHPAGNQLRVHANTPYGYLDAPNENLQVNLLQSNHVSLPKESTPVEAQPLRPTDTAYLEQITRQMSYQNPYAPLEQVFSKRSVSALTHEQGELLRVPRPAFLQQEGLSSAEKGTALHAFMQYADYSAAANDPQREIQRLVEQAFITPQQGAVVDAQKLNTFFQSQLYHRMESSQTLLREHRFMAALPVTQIDPSIPKEFEQETTVVQGIVDCMFEENGGFTVVDYKTDRVKTPEELVKRYEQQLTLYAKILKESSGIQVKELLLYSFHLSQAIPVPMDCN